MCQGKVHGCVPIVSLYHRNESHTASTSTVIGKVLAQLIVKLRTCLETLPNRVSSYPAYGSQFNYRMTLRGRVYTSLYREGPDLPRAGLMGARLRNPSQTELAPGSLLQKIGQ